MGVYRGGYCRLRLPLRRNPREQCVSIRRHLDRNALRSEEHTAELQSLRHLRCLAVSPFFPYTTLFRSDIGVGPVGFVYHFAGIHANNAFRYDGIWIETH